MSRKTFLGIWLTMAGLASPMAWAGPDHAHDDSHNEIAHQTPLAVARHLQQAHRFSAAADILAAYLYQSPFDTEAQLLYADVLRYAGRFDESRAVCARVALAGATTLAGFCAVQILVDTQEFDLANEYSDKLADQVAHLSADARIWALEVSAEAAWRAGEMEAARQRYEEAISFDHVPHSTLDAYRQFLDAERQARTQVLN